MFREVASTCVVCLLRTRFIHLALRVPNLVMKLMRNAPSVPFRMSGSWFRFATEMDILWPLAL